AAGGVSGRCGRLRKLPVACPVRAEQEWGSERAAQATRGACRGVEGANEESRGQDALSTAQPDRRAVVCGPEGAPWSSEILGTWPRACGRSGRPINPGPQPADT